MEKKWITKPTANQEAIIQLIETLGVSRPIANILAQRKITNFDKAKLFLRPDLNQLHDPFLMRNMESAVNRIEEAIIQNENILIYGDYDVDGTTAVALVFEYLHKTYDQIGYYIPDRYKEGYGVSRASVDFAIDNSFSLIIALDCGIKANQQVAYAKENGVDYIICDHHTPGEYLPEAIILNPKQKECAYPFKELSGCGVGFKLVQALTIARKENFDEIHPLLDLVVVSIGADIVSMTGENRVLAYFGLQLLNATPRLGFKKLLSLSKKTGELSIMDVVFALAPRINAAGRIESGNQAVELLLAQTEEAVNTISKLINVHNDTRKELDKAITAEALKMIVQDDWLLNANSTVVFNKDWHKGVVGIVASRLIENYHRPTIVLTESNGEAVGSARSVKGFNVYDAIDQCSDLLTQFGGHYHAAGLTMPIDNIPAFKLKFNAVATQMLSEEMKIPEIEIDTEIDFRDIFEHQVGGIPKFYRILKQLAPFGPDNMAPTFLTRNVKDTGYSRVLKDEHLKLSLHQDEFPDIIIDAIAFGFGNLWERVKTTPFDIVYTIAENHWQGRTSLQLMIKDIRFGNT